MRIDLKHFSIRWGMVAPKFYIRIFRLIIMWWGWNNGKLEILF